MPTPTRNPGWLRRGWRRVIGAPRDLGDPQLFHHVSLVAFLAWVGLGADGLSSSAYGPEEAYKALGSHTHLALLLFLMMAATIAVISLAYSNLIEFFPGGGGGYLVASKLLGSRVGVVSGCALLVDYVLTITISVASGCDQLWSFLPVHWQPFKLAAEFAVLSGLMVLNLRGVKESVSILMPIFVVFLATHLVAIAVAVGGNAASLPGVVAGAAADFRGAVSSLGFGSVLLVLLRAYSLGGGTYTGIEAVSNGVLMLREPRVQTARRTMALMAFSLAFTAGGILLGYLLTDAHPLAGRTMNAVLLGNLFGGWRVGGMAIGRSLVVVALAAEAALLFVAAQAGFLDGPRVLANMARDSWMPHRFAHLSDRLVAKNGVALMAFAAGVAMLYTRGAVSVLVVMYSINVFITFSLTTFGMARHWILARTEDRRWKRLLALHGVGFLMSGSILVVTTVEKFRSGGWITLLVTAAVVALCFWVRRHYDRVQLDLGRLDEVLIGSRPPDPETGDHPESPLDRRAPTAVVCVRSFSGFGLHQVLSIHRTFPGFFRNYVFISAAVLDSGSFKGQEEVGHLRTEAEQGLRRYVAWARAHGLEADWRLGLGTEAVSVMQELSLEIAREYPRAVIFLGKLVFREEKWYHRLLHNETALAVQRRLQFEGLQSIVQPIRVLEA